MPSKLELEAIAALLDTSGVNLMVYDSLRDAGWIQAFSTHPGWELVSQDQETALFRRTDCVYSPERCAYVQPYNPLKT